MKNTTIGIDLAKNVFEIYVEERGGQVVERCRLSRKKMVPWFANRPPAVVGMEACGGAHYWVRTLEPARPRGAADCSPVCEAVGAEEQE